jgi:hypothetical protein
VAIHHASVAIHGSGIAASSCAHLLTREGLTVSWDGSGRSQLPAVMLSESSQNLLLDIFEQADLFHGLPQVRRRIVAWGRSAPVELPHAAVVASERDLLSRIQPREGISSQHDPAGDWSIYAARPLPDGVDELHFGSRTASATAVKLKSDAPADACWTESLERGWLFLLPGSEGTWLLSVGASADDLLSESRLVAKQIAQLDENAARFVCHPRMADPLCATGWFACGTAALAFDPLCGDGVGNAAREAILAAAAVRAILAGAEAKGILEHYRTRLLAGFERHLKLCREFYASGRSSPWWDEQIDACDRGIAWCRSKLQLGSQFSYRLRGFSLEPIEMENETGQVLANRS